MGGKCDKDDIMTSRVRATSPRDSCATSSLSMSFCPTNSTTVASNQQKLLSAAASTSPSHSHQHNDADVTQRPPKDANDAVDGAPPAARRHTSFFVQDILNPAKFKGSTTTTSATTMVVPASKVWHPWRQQTKDYLNSDLTPHSVKDTGESLMLCYLLCVLMTTVINFVNKLHHC